MLSPQLPPITEIAEGNHSSASRSILSPLYGFSMHAAVSLAPVGTRLLHPPLPYLPLTPSWSGINTPASPTLPHPSPTLPPGTHMHPYPAATCHYLHTPTFSQPPSTSLQLHATSQASISLCPKLVYLLARPPSLAELISLKHAQKFLLPKVLGANWQNILPKSQSQDSRTKQTNKLTDNQCGDYGGPHFN